MSTQMEEIVLLEEKGVHAAAASDLSLIGWGHRGAKFLTSHDLARILRMARSFSNSLSGNPQEGVSSPSLDVSKQHLADLS